ncbi:hypothetical protein SAMN05443144_102112 [Fodinibius roseus]|uniref:Uncharacterized protein n=1 Tax=Fodinibius roseus TaxID=1194090 RepID=A0A1M4URU3_9BACT|nr:hypothetical protein SAMN05443144_102112 [Fodinibius roseus]
MNNMEVLVILLFVKALEFNKVFFFELLKW